MEGAQARRIAALRAHLASLSVSETQGMQIQDCAAANGIIYGRVEDFKTSFARPSETIPDRDVRVFNTAMRFGVGAFESAKTSDELQRKRLDRERLTTSMRKHRYKMRLQRRDAQNEASKTMLVSSNDTNPGSLPVCLSASGWTPQVHKIVRRLQDTYIFLLPGVPAGMLRHSYKGNVLNLTGTRIQGMSYVASENGLENYHVHTSSNSEDDSCKVSTNSQEASGPETLFQKFSLSYRMPYDYAIQPKLRPYFVNGRLRVVFERKSLSNTPELSLRRRHNAGM